MFNILDEVCTPKRGTKYSAYVDLFARENVTIGAGETKIVKLGVKLDLEEIINGNDEVYNNPDKFLKSHYLEVALRSSLAVKGLIIANGIGIIDLDYPDEIGLIVHYPLSLVEYQDRPIFKSRFIIDKGDKVAQCTLKEHQGFLMGYESDIVRKGGFGSTGLWQKN